MEMPGGSKGKGVEWNGELKIGKSKSTSFKDTGTNDQWTFQ